MKKKNCHRSTRTSECGAEQAAKQKPTQKAAIQLIRLYQYVISPLFAPSCRFYPSCSDYAREAIETHGFVRGTVQAIGRIIRCNPWHQGGFDPVKPTQTKQL